jgi:hypothetical protein
VLGELEASRKLVKRPFDDACKLIQAKAKEVALPLERESTRLKAELSRVYVEARRSELEEQKELEDLATKARVAAMRESNEAEAEKLNQLAGRALATSQSVVTQVSGLSIRLGWNKAIVDKVKIANTNPHLLRCKLNDSAVNELIKVMEESGTTIEEDSIPGIKLTPKGTVSVRS